MLIGFLVLIIIITLTACCITCKRTTTLPPHYPSSSLTSNTNQGLVTTIVKVGLDEATLDLPELLYSKIKFRNGNSTALCCSVCLANYKDWMLPDCGHVFHLKCVDSWLRLHPSCPICWNLPDAVAGPLAGEVPVPFTATVRFKKVSLCVFQ